METEGGRGGGDILISLKKQTKSNFKHLSLLFYCPTLPQVAALKTELELSKASLATLVML